MTFSLQMRVLRLVDVTTLLARMRRAVGDAQTVGLSEAADALAPIVRENYAAVVDNRTGLLLSNIQGAMVDDRGVVTAHPDAFYWLYFEEGAEHIAAFHPGQEALDNSGLRIIDKAVTAPIDRVQ